MAYAFVVHKLKSYHELGTYVFNHTWLQRPIVLNVVVKTAIIDVVHQEVQVVVILETAYYLYKMRRLVQCLQDIPFAKH